MKSFFSYPCRPVSQPSIAIALGLMRTFGVLIATCVFAMGSSDLYGLQTESKIVKSPQQWREELNEIEYHVTREKGTEFAYSGNYWNHKEEGVYICRCCGKRLFDSKAKFESGTGWPSYFQPIDPSAVSNIRDTSDGMVRTEVVCSRCDAHLGHVFDDGPNPTGLRYCMNSVALGFEQSKKALPEQLANQVAKQEQDHGFESPQKLLDAVSIAVAENSKGKFLKAVCWERLSEDRKSALASSTRPITAKPVRSLRLADRTGTAPAGFVYNVEHVGNVVANFEGGSSGSIWAYGQYDGKFFIAVPVKDGSLAELDAKSETTSDRD